MSMNIYALGGHKVRCVALEAGLESDRRIARSLLKLGEIYTVRHTDVQSFRTDVSLVEIAELAMFNSLHFEDVTEQSQEDDEKHEDYKYYH